MGLLQKAVETFDAHRSLAGVATEGKEILAPVSHMTSKVDIVIELDKNGAFHDARNEGGRKVIIPVTESSAGRAGINPVPHPLCDQISYIANYDERKHFLYVSQLSAWASSPFSHPMLSPILTYVRNGTILHDLSSKNLITLNDKGIPENEKTFIAWKIIEGENEKGECFSCKSLFNAFSAWIESQQNGDTGLCMITGQQAVIGKQHPKGIIASSGNAKLISSNDETNFTYRGRFWDNAQAATVGYIASQKAHNALRWLAADKSVNKIYGSRSFLCWSPTGSGTPHMTLPVLPFDLPDPPTTPSDYKKDLLKAITGFKNNFETLSSSSIVIATFDAATTGRLSLTYYNELRGSDFLQRLFDWDSTCHWWDWNYSRKCYFDNSPSLVRIVDCAFGKEQVEKGITKLVTDPTLLRNHIQRLVTSRLDQMPFPADIKNAIVHRASQPLAFSPSSFRLILSTACAVVKKYYYDHYKEDLDMALDTNRKDRSYQFGRLLAVADKVERDTYDRDEARETNAMRLHSVFTQHPLHTARILEEQLERAYFPRLTPGTRIYYKTMISDIYDIIHQFPEHEWNKSLGDTYLLGYYLQRKELYQSKSSKTQEEK